MQKIELNRHIRTRYALKVSQRTKREKKHDQKTTDSFSPCRMQDIESIIVATN